DSLGFTVVIFRLKRIIANRLRPVPTLVDVEAPPAAAERCFTGAPPVAGVFVDQDMGRLFRGRGRRRDRFGRREIAYVEIGGDSDVGSDRLLRVTGDDILDLVDRIGSLAVNEPAAEGIAIREKIIVRV